MNVFAQASTDLAALDGVGTRECVCGRRYTSRDQEEDEGDMSGNRVVLAVTVSLLISSGFGSQGVCSVEQMTTEEMRSVRGGYEVIGWLGSCDIDKNCDEGCIRISPLSPTWVKYNSATYRVCRWWAGIACGNSNWIRCNGKAYASKADCEADTVGAATYKDVSKCD
jgi:hypothetical protein